MKWRLHVLAHDERAGEDVTVWICIATIATTSVSTNGGLGVTARRAPADSRTATKYEDCSQV
eukprot:2604232-Rhodomonas_salina.1